MIKVRFHLGAGENYLKWQVKYPNGVVKYYNPTDVNLLLHRCKLINHRAMAERICAGEHKDVCAWIECDSIDYIFEPNGLAFLTLKEDHPIRYNPKVRPYWTNKNDEDIDNLKCDCIITRGEVFSW